MQVLTVSQVMEKLSISRTKVYELIRNHGFPKPFHPGNPDGRSYWDEQEINNWLTSKKEMEHGGSTGEAEDRVVGADV